VTPGRPAMMTHLQVDVALEIFQVRLSAAPGAGTGAVRSGGRPPRAPRCGRWRSGPACSASAASPAACSTRARKLAVLPLRLPHHAACPACARPAPWPSTHRAPPKPPGHLLPAAGGLRRAARSLRGRLAPNALPPNIQRSRGPGRRCASPPLAPVAPQPRPPPPQVRAAGRWAPSWGAGRSRGLHRRRPHARRPLSAGRRRPASCPRPLGCRPHLASRSWEAPCHPKGSLHCPALPRAVVLPSCILALLFLISSASLMSDASGSCAVNGGQLPPARFGVRVPLGEGPVPPLAPAPWDVCIPVDLAIAAGKRRVCGRVGGRVGGGKPH
jgi:hypothetical protein